MWMGLEYTEHHKVFIMLSSLGSSYDVFAVILESVPHAQLTMAYLTGRYIEEEQKRADNLVARTQLPPKKAASAVCQKDPGIITESRCYTHIHKICPERSSCHDQLMAGTWGICHRRGHKFLSWIYLMRVKTRFGSLTWSEQSRNQMPCVSYFDGQIFFATCQSCKWALLLVERIG